MAGSKAGWSVETVRTLEDGHRLGGEGFSLGWRAGLCVVRHKGRLLVIVGNENGDLDLYEDFLSGAPRRLFTEKVGNIGDHEPLGTALNASPDAQMYPTTCASAVPGAFDILVWYRHAAAICRCAKLPNEAEFVFDWHRAFLNVQGIPATFLPRRKGCPDLLVGHRDGILRWHRRKPDTEKMEFEEAGAPVLAGDEPIQSPGWCYPCIVDWDGTGKQDLLIGTEEGRVLLYRDLGGEEVRYARAMVLRTPSALVDMGACAIPAAIPGERGIEGLIVANEEGQVFHYPIRERQALVTSDLGLAFSRSRRILTEQFQEGCWQLRRNVPGSRSGQIITNSPVLGKAEQIPGMTVKKAMENAPPPIELDLDLDGRYEIHIGVYEPEALERAGRYVQKVTCRVMARLSGEKDWTVIDDEGVTPDIFFKAASLRGQRLLIQPLPAAGHFSGAWPVYLSYVRLVPVDDVRPCRTTSLPDKAFRAAAILDTASWYRNIRLTTQEDMDVLMAAHANAGFQRVHYKLGGACWEYPSKVPETGLCIEPVPWLKEEDYADGKDFLRIMQEVDRLEMAVKSAKKHGLELYGWIRLQNYGEHFSNGYPVSTFHRDHPEFYEKDREGRPAPAKMSLAYPEVRNYELAVIREAVGDYGVDGILIDFLRQLPVVCYADPVCERFKSLYGEDALKVLPTDTRWLKVRAEFSNLFLKEVRQLLDQVNPKAELHVRLALPRLADGLDPAAIAASGDVQEIIIEYRGMSAVEPDLEGMLNAQRGGTPLPARGAKCRICAGYQRSTWDRSRFPMHPETVRKTSEKFYRLGARDVSIYETAAVVVYPNLCRAIRRLRDSAEYFPIS